ncbi:MAG: STAS domain-containing protein [Nitrospinae bacterium]|nr:STAS domain-containing protein [Nitrospinota bacterium]
MDIKSSFEKGLLIVRPNGDIDMHSSPELRKELRNYFRNETDAILIDLSGVKYMDSSGIAVFVECLQWEKASKKKFIIFSMADNIKGVFEMARLDTLFTIVKSEVVALEKIK